MKSVCRTVLAAVIVMLLAGDPVFPAPGGPPPGRWEKVARSGPGDRITVTTRDGLRRELRFRGIDDRFLTCADGSGVELRIELAEIDRIVRDLTSKYARSGALIGAGVGGGLGAYLLSTTTIGDDHKAVAGFLTIASFTGIGILGGFLTGAAMGATGETIYISREAALREVK